jgi:FkbM family methyltransferase
MYKRQILYKLDQIKMCKKIAIYGAGKIGVNFAKICIKNKINIECFIDTFKDGRSGNLKILTFDHLINTTNFDCIIIASSLWDEVEDKLLFNNIKNFFILSNDLVYQSTDLKSLGSFIFKKNILPKLQIVKKYFKGETKIFFNYLIEMHFNKNQDKLFEFLKYSKRIAPPYVDFINYLGQNITIIDGGIADGKETLGFFKKFNNPIVYAFEPFIKTVNFNNFILNNIPLDLIKVRAEALWKKDEILNFEIKKNSPTTSNITNKGNFKVKGVKIDSFVKYNRIKSVQLIKLDIEGAEYEALCGAKNTIKKHKPYLAISIYHKKEHLYQIPVYLKKLNPEYEFKIVFYTTTFIDTILYAIPK